MKAKQPSLFKTIHTAYGAEARASSQADTPTRAEAEAWQTASGKRDMHARIAWALVLAMPGSTIYELWDKASERERTELGTFHELYRRLNDLRHEMALKQGPSRKCRIRGTRMVIWEPA
jgi:hypothetical protein